MSELTKMLRREQRRHFAMSFGLVGLAVFAGTMVTNERGVFSNVWGGTPLSAFAKAFAGLANPGERPAANLFRRVASAGPVDTPFDVLGSPADLRRRLMEALGGDGDLADQYANGSQLPAILTQPITPIEVANNDVPGPLGNFPGARVAPTPGPTLLEQQPTGGGTDNPPATDTGNPPPTDIGTPPPADTTNPPPAGTDNPPPTGTGNPPPTDTGNPPPIDTGNPPPIGDGGPPPGDPGNPPLVTPPVAPVPEPAVWALMIGGFGAVGLMLRRADRRRRLILDEE